jgi:uncharacterized protein (UPF0332 family)
MNTAKAHIQKALKRLHVAQKLLQDNEYEDAVSRAYYAMYHAAKAALATVNTFPKTHEGIVTEFGKKLILTGTFPKELGKNLANAKAARETYEYTTTTTPNKTETEKIVLNAQTFVRTIQQYLEQK